MEADRVCANIKSARKSFMPETLPEWQFRGFNKMPEFEKEGIRALKWYVIVIRVWIGMVVHGTSESLIGIG
jgi:hypothetical protein